jgi:hypothetical protein
MAEFSRRIERAAGKEHRCEQCRKVIPIGERHSYWAGKAEGYLSSYREHMDCRDAWLSLNWEERPNWPDDEELAWLCDDDVQPEERAWMAGRWPAVAERMGWSAPARTKGAAS